MIARNDLFSGQYTSTMPAPTLGKFKGHLTKVGAGIGTNAENSGESFNMLHKQRAQYAMNNYEHTKDIIPLIRILMDIVLSLMEPTEPSATKAADGMVTQPLSILMK